MIKLINKFFNTQPFIFHMNGSHTKNKSGRRLRSKVFEYMDTHSYDGAGGIRDTTYFACTSYDGRETSLEKTLKYFKVPYVMKGRGTRGWVNTMKAGLLADYLPNIDTEYTMGIDSHDVCLLRDANGIVDKFESDFGCDMLFNAELISYPTNLELAQYERGIYGVHSPFCYLNSGVWIARTKFLKEVINDILEFKSSRPQSDQEIYRRLHQKYYPAVQIDFECKIFQTTCSSSKRYLRDDKYDSTNAFTVSIEDDSANARPWDNYLKLIDD